MDKKAESKKRLFFVRHGEPETFSARVAQTDQTPLSGEGRQRAREVAEYLKNYPFEKVLCSTQTRGIETAEIIADVLGLDTEHTTLLSERKWPSELTDLDFDGEETLRIKEELHDHFHEVDYHYSNEENFTDLKVRCLELLEYIKGRPEESLVIVSHSYSMTMMLACMLYGRDLTSHIFQPMQETIATGHTSITRIYYYPNPRPGKYRNWVLYQWNARPHIDEEKRQNPESSN